MSDLAKRLSAEGMTLEEAAALVARSHDSEVVLYKEWEVERPTSHVVGGAKVTEDWNDFSWGEIRVGKKAIQFRPSCIAERLLDLHSTAVGDFCN